jgi:murein DD-endopeptidase MepM/ murein hydrolase activator NlpD
MKKLFIINALLLTSTMACAQPEVDCDLYPDQQSSPYLLPYQVGEAFPVVVSTGHYRASNQGVGLYAIDFDMPIGTKIVASRTGEVVAVRETFHDGNGKDLEENYVFIRHSDGTIARYFHLTHNGALVNEGDKVKAGDLIAISGDTGQTLSQHLHFDVQQCGPNLPPGYNKLPCGQTIPVTFKNTSSHSCGLEEGVSYKAL